MSQSAVKHPLEDADDGQAACGRRGARNVRLRPHALGVLLAQGRGRGLDALAAGNDVYPAAFRTGHPLGGLLVVGVQGLAAGTSKRDHAYL